MGLARDWAKSQISPARQISLKIEFWRLLTTTNTEKFYLFNLLDYIRSRSWNKKKPRFLAVFVPHLAETREKDNSFSFSHKGVFFFEVAMNLLVERKIFEN